MNYRVFLLKMLRELDLLAYLHLMSPNAGFSHLCWKRSPFRDGEICTREKELEMHIREPRREAVAAMTEWMRGIEQNRHIQLH